MIDLTHSWSMASFLLPPLIILLAWLVNKNLHADKRKEQQKSYQQLLEDPRTIRVSQWLTINQVDEQDYDGWRDLNLAKASLYSPYINIALFSPGTYRLIVSSFSDPDLQYIPLTITLEAGRNYQLGCDIDGPYCSEEFVVNSYDLEQMDLENRSIAY